MSDLISTVTKQVFILASSLTLYGCTVMMGGYPLIHPSGDASWIKRVENPTEDQQLKAVKESPRDAIKFIKFPTEAVLLASVTADPSSIQYIKNPNEKIQLATIKSLKDKYNALGVLQIFKSIKNPTEKAKIAIVTKDGSIIQHIKNPSEKVQLAAVNQDGRVIRYIKNPTEKVQLDAFRNRGDGHVMDGYKVIFFIELIKNPTEKVQLAAINENIHSLKKIKNPSEKIKLAAVNKDGFAIQHIKNPSENIQLAAVRQNGHAVVHIDNPTRKVVNHPKVIVALGLIRQEKERASHSRSYNCSASGLVGSYTITATSRDEAESKCESKYPSYLNTSVW